MAGNQNNNRFANMAPRHAFNDFRFRLVGKDRLEGGTRPPNIGFDVNIQGLKIVGRTNVDGDKDYGRIQATMTLPDAMYLITVLEKLERQKPGIYHDFVIAESQYDKASNSRKTKKSATLRIGKDDGGVAYIDMSSWDTARPKIHVDFLPSNFTRLVDSAGEPVRPDRVSGIYAASWAKSLSTMLPIMWSKEYPRLYEDHQVRRAQSGGGQNWNQGNQNRNNQGQGQQNYGNSNQSQQSQSPAPSSGGSDGFEDFSDDLPL